MHSILNRPSTKKAKDNTLKEKCRPKPLVILMSTTRRGRPPHQPATAEQEPARVLEDLRKCEEDRNAANRQIVQLREDLRKCEEDRNAANEEREQLRENLRISEEDRETANLQLQEATTMSDFGVYARSAADILSNSLDDGTHYMLSESQVHALYKNLSVPAKELISQSELIYFGACIFSQ